jgi:hypothetical protein
MSSEFIRIFLVTKTDLYFIHVDNHSKLQYLLDRLSLYIKHDYRLM